ncbi:MAG: hypothetical protein ACR2JD_01615 [Nocardioides sp.]
MTPRIVAPVIAALAVFAAGCSGEDDPTVQPTETATTSSESPTDVPSSAGELPEGFPTEEVPLVEGEIGEVLENPARGSYLVKIYPDTDFGVAFEDASAQLVGAGFEQGPDVISAGPTSSTADFTSDDWFVIVTGGLPGRTLVQYTIQPNE